MAISQFLKKHKKWERWRFGVRGRGNGAWAMGRGKGLYRVFKLTNLVSKTLILLGILIKVINVGRNELFDSMTVGIRKRQKGWNVVGTRKIDKNRGVCGGWWILFSAWGKRKRGWSDLSSSFFSFSVEIILKKKKNLGNLITKACS